MIFSGNKIKITESKYYAYRGLYLSSSKRIDSEELRLTPETFVVVQDERIASGKRENKPATGYNYQRNVPLLTAEKTTNSDETIDYQFLKPKTEEFFYVETPFDGSGFITSNLFMLCQYFSWNIRRNLFSNKAPLYKRNAS